MIVASAGPEYGRVRRRRGDGPIKFRTSFRNTIYDVMKGRGWVETDSEFEWDFQWAERDWVYDSFDTMHLESWQRLNHFRNGRELCRKDLLAKNIKRVKRQLEREGRTEEASRYDFTPITFVLPGEYALFVEEFKKPQHTNCIWIMKPIGKSQGKGIFLFNKLSQITQWKSDYRWKPDNPGVEAYIVQKYLANPYLIGGKKFDMRVYALVTSFQPLTVYTYRSGFSRFSASRYNSDPAEIFNNFVHLTNVAIQKTAENYNAETGGKWELKRLKNYLLAKHGRAAVTKLFVEMQDIILYSLFAVQKAMIADKHCFEMYGYDILIDDELKPWLIEVNASPSLTANTREDYDLKYKLLNDVLDIIDMEDRTTGTEERMGGFDLIWRDGPVAPTPATVWGCLMGADFDKALNVFKTKGPPAAVMTPAAGAGGGVFPAPGLPLVPTSFPRPAPPSTSSSGMAVSSGVQAQATSVATATVPPQVPPLFRPAARAQAPVTSNASDAHPSDTAAIGTDAVAPGAHGVRNRHDSASGTATATGSSNPSRAASASTASQTTQQVQRRLSALPTKGGPSHSPPAAAAGVSGPSGGGVTTNEHSTTQTSYSAATRPVSSEGWRPTAGFANPNGNERATSAVSRTWRGPGPLTIAGTTATAGGPGLGRGVGISAAQPSGGPTGARSSTLPKM